MTDPVPYHELARTVERMEAELGALGPLAEVALRADKRAEAADARAAKADERADRAHEAMEKAYRRGYSTGYGAARRGRPADPDASVSDPRSLVQAVA